MWHAVVAALRKHGWHARVVSADHLEDLRARLERVLASGELPYPVAKEVAPKPGFRLPDDAPAPRSVVVAALGRPLTQATLTLSGTEHTFPVPPHYAGYHTQPAEMVRIVTEVLAAAGHGAARFDPPLKTLAACAGLARYGRNNIAYVAGLGSYHELAACVTDAPPPAEAAWGEPQVLARCERCVACLRACPTGAIDGDRFLLHTERCLTYLNEDAEPFPDWVRPEWHTCAVGCLGCQRVCPENVAPGLTVAPPERFDERESAAILAADDHASLSAATRAKLDRCGLDYSAELIARNLRAMLDA
jgi:epoxyqueuosine reductase